NRLLQGRGGDHRKLGRRALQVPTGLETPEHREPPAFAGSLSRYAAELPSDNWLRADRKGHVETVAYRDAIKTGRRYSNDREGMAVEGQRLAHRRGGAAISPLPERVADVDRAGASLTIVFTRDQPSEHRPNAQGVEKLSAGPNDIRHVHFAAFGADAQGEGENGDHGEAGRLDQNAQAVPNVLNQVSHGRLTSQDT